MDDELVASRKALLDALDALEPHRDALVLVGAQAIYLWTGDAAVALAETTDDSDVAVDRRVLEDDPLLEEAMKDAGFHLDLVNPQPGSWLSPDGVPVDLMLPEAMAGEGGSRSARVPPHSKHSFRRAVGLEAAIVDNRLMTIRSLDPEDGREYEILVATPAALLVAKLHKLADRRLDKVSRQDDKDAHDLYRLLVAVPTGELAEALAHLKSDALAGEVTVRGLGLLEELFAAGPDAPGSVMAGRAEQEVGDPDIVAASVSELANDLLKAVRDLGSS